MDALAAWLPWIMGLFVALIIVRFVVGIALRLLAFGALILVGYVVWRAFTGG